MMVSSMAACKQYETNLNEQGGGTNKGETVYFDRHNVQCKAGTAMTGWHLTRGGNSCAAPSDGPFLITSHRGQQLEDRHGRLGMHHHRQGWQQWHLIYAGHGEYYVVSHRNQQLEDRHGWIGLHHDRAGWQKWKLIEKDNGKFLIRSHRGQQLEDRHGWVGLHWDQAGWQEWTITNWEGKPLCMDRYKEIKFVYTCCELAENVLGKCSEEKTKLNDGGGSKWPSVYLDRHNVQCKKGTAMSGWRLDRGGTSSEYQIKYKCCEVNPAMEQCKDKETPANDWGDGQTVYMDRHNAQCGDDQIMTTWKLHRPKSDQINIKYKCCDAPMIQVGGTTTTTTTTMMVSSMAACKKYETNLNAQGGDGETVYFDRHNVQCKDGTAMTGWKLTRGGTHDKIKFAYTCCDMNSNVLGECSEESTKLNDGGGSKWPSIYLDRHKVKCKKGTAMTGWRLDRGGTRDKYKIKYKCCKVSPDMPKCTTKKTPKNDWGDGKSIYLDRHNAQCDSGQMMTSWQLQRPKGDKIRFKYKCCEAPKVALWPGGLFVDPGSLALKSVDEQAPTDCKCLPCGTPSSGPNAFPSGVCGPSTTGCSPTAAGAGCYSSTAAVCDCATKKPVTKVPTNCKCLPCGTPSSGPNAYPSGVCGPSTTGCSPTAAGAGCYSSTAAICDCATKKPVTNLLQQNPTSVSRWAGGVFEDPDSLLQENSTGLTLSAGGAFEDPDSPVQKNSPKEGFLMHRLMEGSGSGDGSGPQSVPKPPMEGSGAGDGSGPQSLPKPPMEGSGSGYGSAPPMEGSVTDVVLIHEDDEGERSEPPILIQDDSAATNATNATNATGLRLRAMALNSQAPARVDVSPHRQSVTISLTQSHTDYQSDGYDAM